MNIQYPLYWLVKVASYLIAACMVLLILFFLLLNTELGSRFTLHQAQRLTNSWVSYESFEGALLRDFTLQGLNINTANGAQLHIQQARLRWWPWQLLQQQAHIRLLDISGVQVQVPETASQTQQSSFVLPDITFNFNIRVDQLLVESAEISTPANTFRINRFQTRGRFENNQLRIHDLQLDMPEGQAQFQANLTPHNDYALTLQGSLSGQVPDIGPVTTNLNINGALKETLAGRIELSDSIGALVEGQLHQPFSNAPEWFVQASLYHVRHPKIAEYVSEFTVQFDGTGSFSEAGGNLVVTATAHEYGFISLRSEAHYLAKEITIEQLNLQASEFAFATELAGKVALAPETLSMAFTATTQWADYPEFSTQLDYQGSVHHVDKATVAMNSARGHLKLEGSAQWLDQPRWDVRLRTENVDLALLPLPEAIRPYLAESRLTSQVVSQGSWDAAGPQLNLQVDQFETTFDQQPLSIVAQANVSQQQLTMRLFELELGEGNVSATVQGAIDQFDLTLTAEQLALLGVEVGALTTELSINTALDRLPIGYVQLSDLRVNADSAPLSAEASLSFNTVYQLDASLQSEQATAALAVQGQWQQDQWQGRLAEFTIDSEEFGHWSLSDSTAIAYSPARTLVEPFCLRVATRSTHVCAELNWQQASETLLAEIDVKQVELALLAPFLPNLVKVEGAIDAQVQFQQQGSERNYNGQVHLHGVGFSLPAQDISLTFSDGELFHFNGDEQLLEGQVNLTTDAVAGGLQADFALSQPFAEAEINANATIDFNTLTIVSLFVPDIQNVKGELDGSFNLSGPLTNPSIGGTMTLSQAAAEVPAAGLVLSDLHVLVESPRSVDAPFLMSATVRSGEGNLLMTGHYDINTHIAALDISGTNFTAMNSREINLVVSPKAQVELSPEQTKVRGSLNVDHAVITPPDFDSVQLSSADTVIVRGEETLWQNTSSSNADVDLQVTLGDDFQVAAYGFEGQLTGQLRVIETPYQDTTAVGTIQVSSGEYELYGQSLTIERGNLVYTGGVISNPGLDLRVSRTFPIENVTVGARVGGVLQEPRFNLYSTPTMQDAEILSYLAFGRGFGDEKSEDENMLLKASLALGMQGGNLLGERLSASLGVDEIMLDAGDTIESTSLYIGKHLSPRLYIQYGIGLIEPVNTFFIRYRLTDYLNFETQTGTLGSGADLFYSIER